MPETKMILDKLHAHGKKLDRMETTLVQLAVQDSEIRHMQNQIVALWSKIDLTHDPDGVFTRILESQAAMLEKQSQCEVHSLSTQIKWLWAAVFAGAMSVIIKNLGGPQ